MTLLSTTNGQIWKSGFGVSPDTSADTTLMFSLVFVFTSCNILTVLKLLVKVWEKSVYPFPPENPVETHTHRATQEKNKTKNKLHKLQTLHQNIGNSSIQNMAAFHLSTGFNLPVHSRGIFRYLVSKGNCQGL